MDDAYKLEVSGDGSAVTWTTLSPEAPAGSKSIPARAQHAAAVTSNGKYVFFFGGYDGTKCLNDVWLLDMSTMALRQIDMETPVPEARSRHTVHIIGDQLHVFAGFDGSKACSGDVFVLDVSDPAGMESGSGGGDGKKKEEEKNGGDDDDD